MAYELSISEVASTAGLYYIDGEKAAPMVTVSALLSLWYTAAIASKEEVSLVLNIFGRAGGERSDYRTHIPPFYIEYEGWTQRPPLHMIRPRPYLKRTAQSWRVMNRLTPNRTSQGFRDRLQYASGHHLEKG